MKRTLPDFIDVLYNKCMKTNCNYDKCITEIADDYLPQENIVANGDLGCIDVDIRNHTKRRPYCHVPPKFESSVDRYIDEQPSTQLLFRSGRNVTVGSKSAEQIFSSMHRQRFDLWRDRIRSDMCTMSIVNMVYVFKIPGVKYLDIAKLHRTYTEDSSWTPTVFPGARFSKAGLLLRAFDTNRMVLMGATNPSQPRAMRDQFAKIGDRFKMDFLPPSEERFTARIKRYDEMFADVEITAKHAPYS